MLGGTGVYSAPRAGSAYTREIDARSRGPRPGDPRRGRVVSRERPAGLDAGRGQGRARRTQHVRVFLSGLLLAAITVSVSAQSARTYSPPRLVAADLPG